MSTALHIHQMVINSLLVVTIKVTVYDLENKGAILHTFEHSNGVQHCIFTKW